LVANIEQEHKEASAKYYMTRKQATELPQQHNNRLHKALAAKKQGLQVDQVKESMNQIERLQMQVSQVGGVQENGQQKIHLNQLNIDRVCGEESLKRFGDPMTGVLSFKDCCCWNLGVLAST
jgi:queuine/archaeosine tRNA-ribosyltransferase